MLLASELSKDNEIVDLNDSSQAGELEYRNISQINPAAENVQKLI